MPLCDGNFRIVDGNFKLPLLRGEVRGRAFAGAPRVLIPATPVARRLLALLSLLALNCAPPALSCLHPTASWAGEREVLQVLAPGACVQS
jgi:hypothetical protein